MIAFDLFGGLEKPAMVLHIGRILVERRWVFCGLYLEQNK
jgi:hypothetical protein